MSAGGNNEDRRKHAPPEGPASAGPYRRHPIHLPPLGNRDRAIIIFVTVCTAGRRRILDWPRSHEVIIVSWRAAESWLVGRYVILPDHVHFFCAPNDFDPPPLERWMQFWKSTVSRNLGEPAGTVWQRHFWDRQLRRGESYDGKWEYVRKNPVRHGLVSKPEDWPYQGVLNELRW